MRYPPEENFVFHLDIIDSLADDVHENLLDDFLKIVGIRDEFQCADCDGIHNVCAICAEIDACLHGLDSKNFNSAALNSVNSSFDLISTASVSVYPAIIHSGCANSAFSGNYVFADFKILIPENSAIVSISVKSAAVMIELIFAGFESIKPAADCVLFHTVHSNSISVSSMC